MPAIEFGLDVAGHIDVVDNEVVELAADVDPAAVAVHDLQAAYLTVANLEAGEVTHVDTSTSELLSL